MRDGHRAIKKHQPGKYLYVEVCYNIKIDRFELFCTKNVCMRFYDRSGSLASEETNFYLRLYANFGAAREFRFFFGTLVSLSCIDDVIEINMFFCSLN